MNNITISEEVLETIATTIALLTRHTYWKDDLWKKRKDVKDTYKNYDRAEIHNAFLSMRLKYHGIYTTPCGISWTRLTNEEKVIEYLKQYEALFDDYYNWQCEQR